MVSGFEVVNAYNVSNDYCGGGFIEGDNLYLVIGATKAENTTGLYRVPLTRDGKFGMSVFEVLHIQSFLKSSRESLRF